MGNQTNSGNNHLTKLCQISLEEDPFKINEMNYAQEPQKYVKNIKEKYIEVHKNIRQQSQQIPQNPQNQLCSQREKASKNYYKLKSGRQINTQSGTKIKRIQNITQTPKNYLSSTQIYKENIKKSFRYFKSLKTLHFFESNFDLTFPLLILNKNKEVVVLRKQISVQKHHHSYFSLKKYQMCEKGASCEGQPPQVLKLKYDLFNLLLKIEKNVTRIFETGRNQNVLTHINKLDSQVGIHPTANSLHRLVRFIDKLNSVNFEFIDMLHYQLSHPELKQKLVFADQFLPTKNSRMSLPVLDVKQFMIKQNDSKKEDNSYQKYKKVGLELYRQNKVCFYILAGKNQSSLSADYSSNLNHSFSKNKSSGISQNSQSPLYHELESLNLPKSPVLLQILLNRYSAFAELLQIDELTIIILANESKTEQIHNLQFRNHKKWKRINLILLKQSQMLCLETDGSLILTKNSSESLNKTIDGNVTNKTFQGLTENQLFQKTGTFSQNLKEIISKQREILKVSAGTGDLWDLLRQQHGEGGLDFLKTREFQYIEVIGSENCLQHCFDCFMLGYIENQSLDCAAKIVDPSHHLYQIERKTPLQDRIPKFRNLDKPLKMNQSKMFDSQKSFQQNDSNFVGQNSSNQLNPSTFYRDTLFFQGKTGSLQAINEYEELYQQKVHQLLHREKSFYTFAHHSIFKVNFVENKIKDPLWKHSVSFKKKTIWNKLINKHINFYQKELTEIFTYFSSSSNSQILQQTNHSKRQFSAFHDDKFMLFKYQRDYNYYPLFFSQNKGIFDIEGASRAISAKFLQFLEISIEKYVEDCKKKAKQLGQEHGQIEQNFVKCYIDPHVSLEGEDLEDIKFQIKQKLRETLSHAKSYNTDIAQSKLNVFTGLPAVQFSQMDETNKSKSEEIEIQIFASKVISNLKQIMIERKICEQFAQNQKQENEFADKDESEEIKIFIN